MLNMPLTRRDHVYKVCSVMGWMRPPYAYSLRWGLWLPAVDGCFAVDDCCELTPRAAIIEAYATTRGTKKKWQTFFLGKNSWRKLLKLLPRKAGKATYFGCV